MSPQKKNSPTKVASRKKAVSPSISSGAPNTSPTSWLHELQFMPDWSFMVMPVATPDTKLITNRVPQNLVICRQMGQFIMT